MSIDYSTDLGKTRLLIPDKTESGLIFSDDEVGAFLAMEGDSRRAAASAIEVIASDKAMTLQYGQLLGMLTVDGTKVSDALLKRAASLRAQAAEADDRDGGAFDIVTMDVDAFTRREILRDAALRERA